MKIKAYQVAPEYQESPMSLFDGCLEGLEIYGNRKTVSIEYYVYRLTVNIFEVYLPQRIDSTLTSLPSIILLTIFSMERTA